MNLAEIRADIADALSPVVAAVKKYPKDLADGYPLATLSIDQVAPQTFGDTSFDIALTVTVVVSESETPEAWDTLDELLSSNVIAEALAEAENVNFVGVYDNIGNEVPHDGQLMLGFTISLTVLA